MSVPTQQPDLLSTMFDTSFSTFITTRLIRVLYGLGLFVLGLIAIVGVLPAFALGIPDGLIMLGIAAIAFVLAAMSLRVVLELIIVVFKTAEM